MESYIALVAAKKAAMGLIPKQTAFMTDVCSTGCATKAAANSSESCFVTMAIHSYPGGRSFILDIFLQLDIGPPWRFLKGFC